MDTIIFFNQNTQMFGARRETESLPAGSAPVAIVRAGSEKPGGGVDQDVVWQANIGSVSFPYGEEVDLALTDWCDFEDAALYDNSLDYTQWSWRKS